MGKIIRQLTFIVNAATVFHLYSNVFLWLAILLSFPTEPNPNLISRKNCVPISHQIHCHELAAYLRCSVSWLLLLFNLYYYLLSIQNLIVQVYEFCSCITLLDFVSDPKRQLFTQLKLNLAKDCASGKFCFV